jgi:hypothetical protein
MLAIAKATVAIDLNLMSVVSASTTGKRPATSGVAIYPRILPILA